MKNLYKQFQNLQNYSKGTLGISAKHIETDLEVNFNSNENFLMCSTYKVPIAICLLYKVELGEINLNHLYDVNAYDLRAGVSSTLNQLDYSVDQQISIRNILQFMLQESCNTSTDIILRLIGGPKVVSNFLKQFGINNMSVDRYVLEILAALDGIKSFPQDHRCTLEQYKELELSVSKEEIIKAKETFKLGLKDSTTPLDMCNLLVKLCSFELINKNFTELLLKIMQGCKRGNLRLKGLLPKSTPIAHKTGSATGYTCDIGIITLPYNLGHIVIASYIKNSTADLTNNEYVLAEVGRSVYDYFLFNIETQ